MAATYWNQPGLILFAVPIAEVSPQHEGVSMNEPDDLLTNEFIFRVPVWTVAYTGTTFSIATIHIGLATYGEFLFGLFTDEDQASRYLDSLGSNETRFRVVIIDTPRHLEYWVQIAEKMGLTHAVFDFTVHASGHGGGRVVPLTEVRRAAIAMEGG